jgi:hypothetical protein
VDTTMESGPGLAQRDFMTRLQWRLLVTVLLTLAAVDGPVAASAGQAGPAGPLAPRAGAQAAAAPPLPAPNRSKSGAPDFMFGQPTGSVAVRATVLLPREGGDLFAFVRDQLTIDKGDFRTTAISAEYGRRITARTTLTFGGEASRATVGQKHVISSAATAFRFSRAHDSRAARSTSASKSRCSSPDAPSVSSRGSRAPSHRTSAPALAPRITRFARPANSSISKTRRSSATRSIQRAGVQASTCLPAPISAPGEMFTCRSRGVTCAPTQTSDPTSSASTGST